MAQLGATLVIEIAGIAILARLLSPADFGVFAAVSAVYMFGQFLGQFGSHPLIIRAPTLSREIIAEINALVGTASVSIAILLMLLAAGLKQIFPSPEVANGLLWLAVTVPLASFGGIGHAMLERDFRFETLFYIRLTASITFVVVAGSGAVAGLGPSALCLGLGASVVVHAVAVLSASRWRVLVRPRFHQLAHFKAARLIFGGTACEHLGYALQPLLIGHAFGPAAVGLYSRAADILRQANRLVNDTILPVLMPHAVEIEKRDQGFRELVAETLSHITVLSWSGGAVLFAVAAPVTSLLLGGQWGEIVPLFQILSAFLIVMPVTNVCRVFLLARKRDAIFFKQALAVLIAITAALVVAGAFDIYMAARLVVLVYGFQALVSLIAACSVAGVSFKTVMGVFATSALVAALAFVAATLSLQWVSGDAAQFVLGAFASAIIWMICIISLRHPTWMRLREFLWDSRR
ncbi:oligosaccharide flippase family protein [Algirhabdus cladophorae]|uniref:oligosaccharide flippase family protein n=1 Tax=Algirhabdus cladophorae TaxID=3377108 RepID=UPI003B8465EA